MYHTEFRPKKEITKSGRQQGAARYDLQLRSCL
jgi:hypothetical protein